MLLHLLRPAGLAGETAAMGYTLTFEQMRHTAYLLFGPERAPFQPVADRLRRRAGAVRPRRLLGLFCRSLCYYEGPGKAETVAQGLHLGAMAGVLRCWSASISASTMEPTRAAVAGPSPASLPPVELGLCYRGSRFTIWWDGVIRQPMRRRRQPIAALGPDPARGASDRAGSVLARSRSAPEARSRRQRLIGGKMADSSKRTPRQSRRPGHRRKLRDRLRRRRGARRRGRERRHQLPLARRTAESSQPDR